MKNRLIGFVSALTVLVGGSLAAASPAQAAPAVMFTKVYYDSPGSDSGSNSSLNAEYVRLTNTRSSVVNLKGWYVRDKTGYTYKFTGDFKVAGKNSILIRTGKGTNKGTNRYWGRSWYVWNNTGDTAYLRNASGSLVDSCSWSKTGSGYTNC
ncbi:lamin tail domain-containing protein [Micromonospora sp. WMMD882]|uniref:lamin tail domain-containing protein n=1 Tax=Micromonospora sp. WMMD882 TaxID=3015151 RepID=UPI00248D07DD|nr:lamin tail domain-containing protein [Micromonospora sp. WMMD882]WBB77593.1 lamin tail domain-containing protein [Micromonospora sp. WMMD882]